MLTTSEKDSNVSLRPMTRGSRIKFNPNTEVLRFFVAWKNLDEKTYFFVSDLLFLVTTWCNKGRWGDVVSDVHQAFERERHAEKRSTAYRWGDLQYQQQ